MTDSEDRAKYLVLGAAGGIGSAVARELARRGGRVFLAGRSTEKLANLADEVDQPYRTLDARDPVEIQEVVEEASERLGGLDGIANCVGSLLLKPAHMTTPEEWDEVVAVNLRSAFGVARAAGKTMRQRGGSVVLVSSAAARVGLANHEAIAAAKAGVIGLTLSAAATYASKNIRFNAVAPGLVRTPMTERLLSNASAEKGSVAMHALGRIGDPNDVSHWICELLDPKNQWITGQVFGIDGGLATVRGRTT